MATRQTAVRLCALEAAVGTARACPEDGCPFWEPGGAALGGRCPFEGLAVAADPGLAEWLLEIRERLARANSSEDETATRSLFRHLLNDSSE
jgi:hypothetical protein